MVFSKTELNVERVVSVWWLTKHGPLTDTDSWTYGPLHNTRTSYQNADQLFTDLLTNHGPTIHGRQTTDLLFTDLIKHGPLFILRTQRMRYEKKRTRSNVKIGIT